MGTKDITTKEFTDRADIFADAFNYFIYGGEKVIDPNTLKEQNTTETDVARTAAGAILATEKIRDVKKLLTIMSDGKCSYILLAIENQSDKHRAMPVKVLRSDSLTYAQQVRRKTREHSKAKEMKSSVDLLSGWLEEDRLTPIITLVIYFGADEWDVPTSLHEMMDIKDDAILRYVPDYKINLIAPASIPDEDFVKFHSELGQVLKFIKHSLNDEDMEKCVADDPTYRDLSPSVRDLLNTVTGANFEIIEGEERFNMCEAIEAMKEKSKLEAVREIVINMLKRNDSPADIIEVCGISKEQVEAIASSIGIKLA